MDGEKVRYSLLRTSKDLCLHFTFVFNIKLSRLVYATNVNVNVFPLLLQEQARFEVWQT